jgi:hypothetical protein
MKRLTVLGLLVIFSVAALALSACGGGDGENDSDRSEFQAAHDAISQMIDRADAGAVDEAETVFEDTHDALHRIEAQVRSVDVPQAQEFSGLIVNVEEELAAERGASRLAELAREILAQIERAADTVGLGPLTNR